MSFIDSLKRIKLSKIVGAIEKAPAALEKASTQVGTAIGNVEGALQKALHGVEDEARTLGQNFSRGARNDATPTLLMAGLGVVLLILLLKKR